MTPRELLDEEKVKGNNYTHFANDDQPMVAIDQITQEKNDERKRKEQCDKVNLLFEGIF